MSHGRTAPHPQQTSQQLPPHLSERLHSSVGEVAWNDRVGREAEDADIAVSIGNRVLTESASDALANKAGATLSVAVKACE